MDFTLGSLDTKNKRWPIYKGLGPSFLIWETPRRWGPQDTTGRLNCAVNGQSPPAYFDTHLKMTANKRDLFCATLSCYAVDISSTHETARLFYSTCHLPPAFIDSLLCYFACSHFNTKRQVKNIVKSGPFSMSAFIIQLPVRSPMSYEALRRLGSGQKSSPQFA